MSAFDPKAFTGALMEDLRGAFAQHEGDALGAVQEARQHAETLARDVEATLAALLVETDPEKQAGLRLDLERFLPARAAAILAALTSELASDAQAFFESVLAVVVKAAIVVAKALV